MADAFCDLQRYITYIIFFVKNLYNYLQTWKFYDIMIINVFIHICVIPGGDGFYCL